MTLPHKKNMMSIGALSQATGIPVNTIRTWEKRYGFPVPHRTSSGHRIYDPKIRSHLQLISKALDKGFRPKQVMGLDKQELSHLLKSDEKSVLSEDLVSAWIQSSIDLNEHNLRSILTRLDSRHGMLMLCTMMIPLLIKAIEDAWLADNLQVHHEHFASEIIRDFLSKKWRDSSTTNDGPLMMATTLPLDQHNLGLHLASCIAIGFGCRCKMLGSNTPVDSIIRACAQQPTDILLISYSSCVVGKEMYDQLSFIRENISANTKIMIGGPKIDKNFTNITSFQSFTSFGYFVEQFTNQRL